MPANDLKAFLKNFDISKPDFSKAPDNFPECGYEGLTSREIGRYNAAKTIWELHQPVKPKARSRVWQSTNGYIYLVAWSNANLLRVLGRSFSATLPRSEYRLKAQLDDNLRSVVANIEEGFAQAVTSRYLEYLGYSQGSLKEGKGDFQRSCQDGYSRSVPGSSLAGLEIDLQKWHEALKKVVISWPAPEASQNSQGSFKGGYRKLGETKGKRNKFTSSIPRSPLRPSKGGYRYLKEVKGVQSFKFGYAPVDNLDPTNLTLEVFIELVNKTDWHLRRLVESLEKKLDEEGKHYQIEKARIRSNIKGN